MSHLDDGEEFTGSEAAGVCLKGEERDEKWMVRVVLFK